MKRKKPEGQRPTVVLNRLPEGQKLRRCEVAKGCERAAGYYYHSPRGLSLCCESCARRLLGGPV